MIDALRTAMIEAAALTTLGQDGPRGWDETTRILWESHYGSLPAPSAEVIAEWLVEFRRREAEDGFQDALPALIDRALTYATSAGAAAGASALVDACLFASERHGRHEAEALIAHLRAQPGQ